MDMSGEDQEMRPVVEVTGFGRHYVWNDDQTELAEKDGPIDGSKPFFVVPDEPSATEGRDAPWPSGWTEIGATRD